MESPRDGRHLSRMTDADARGLRHAAVLLLAASLIRWGWQASLPAPPGAAAPPDTLAGLLAESRELADEEARRSTPLRPDERLDPNRAPAAELDRLPGVGPSTASAIVASRERDGPFRTPDDLARVRGVGPATVERIRDHLDLADLPAGGRSPPGRRRRTAAGPASPGAPDGPPPAGAAAPAGPIDVNRAPAALLETLPGVGPALAARIVAARAEQPFAGVDDLLRVRGIGPATLERLRGRVTAGGGGR